MKNILLASYGIKRDFKTRKPISFDEATYKFKDSIHKTRYFFLGLCKLLDAEIDEIFLLLTEESRSAYEGEMQEQAKQIGVKLNIIDIPKGKTIEEVWSTFDIIVERIATQNSSECLNIYLDITNGFRHLPLISYTSLVYLETLYNMKVAGVYYGALDAKDEKTQIVPVFDLTSLSKIVRGSFAVGQFEKSGAISQLKDFFADVAEDNSLSGLSDIKRMKFEELDKEILAGLPIESGIQTAKIIKELQKPIVERELKSLDNLKKKVVDKLEKISLPEGAINKTKLLPTKDELDRQLNFIKWHIDAKNISTALLLLREWFISRFFMNLPPQQASKWILRKERDEAENRLFRAKNFDNSQNENEKTTAKMLRNWFKLKDIRNQYAHAGFRENVVSPDTGFAKAVQYYERYKEYHEQDELWQIPETLKNEIISDNKTILITPMGASKGLLYSALLCTQPDEVVVLTSDKYLNDVPEVCKKANFLVQNNVHILVIKDPFAGFNEASSLAEQIISHLTNASKIMVNMTGGTTAMQWVMQKTYEEIRPNFEQSNLFRLAFVDKRPVTEQQANPFVQGELINIDKKIIEQNA